MNDKMHSLDPSQLPDALKKLAMHLSALDTQGGTDQSLEGDMLSLLISGILNGENMEERYPVYYKKLLGNAELRQAFLDALESIEAERSGDQVPLPGPAQKDLSFLKDTSAPPKIEIRTSQDWSIIWQRTVDQIQAVFFPLRGAFRTDLNLFEEDPWYTLLREQMDVEGVTYDVVLDCTLSNENVESLSTYLNLAVTLADTTGTAQFPLRASFQWGEYQDSILIKEEGRVKFPDVPLDSVFDQAVSRLKAGFSFSLESAP